MKFQSKVLNSYFDSFNYSKSLRSSIIIIDNIRWNISQKSHNFIFSNKLSIKLNEIVLAEKKKIDNL